MTRLLITRPAPFAAETALHLTARGYECVVAPALVARHLPPVSIDTDGATLLVTSPQAALALAAWRDLHFMETLAVGDPTAELAGVGGFRNVRSASGNAATLVGQVAPAQTCLLAAAPTTGHALQRALGDRAVRRIDVYEVGPADSLPSDIGDISHVLFYSARTATAFLDLARRANLIANLSGVEALCLSEAVAGVARGVAWKTMKTAAAPTAAALHDLLPALE